MISAPYHHDMSWFDSSFGFARTALSQAQKSIDKVLDIREDQTGTNEPDPPSTTGTPSPSSDEPRQSPLFSTSTPRPGSSKSAASTTKTASLTSTPVVASPSPNDSFTSTWGGADSLWNSLTSSAKSKELVKPVVGEPVRHDTPVRQNRGAPTKSRDSSTSSLPSTPSSPVSSSSSRGRGGKLRRERKDSGSRDSGSAKRAPLTHRQHSTPSTCTTGGPSAIHRRGGDSSVEKQSVRGERSDGELTVGLSEAAAMAPVEREGERRVSDNKSAVVATSVPSPPAQNVPSFNREQTLTVQHTMAPGVGTTSPALDSPPGDVAGESAVVAVTEGQEERDKESVKSKKTSENVVVGADTTDGVTSEVKSDSPHEEDQVASLQPMSSSPLPTTTSGPAHALLPVEQSTEPSGKQASLLTEVPLSHTQHKLHEGDTAPVNQSSSPHNSSTASPVDHHQLSSPSPLPISHSPFPISPSPPTSTTPEPTPSSRSAADEVHVTVQEYTDSCLAGLHQGVGGGGGAGREEEERGKVGSECLGNSMTKETTLPKGRSDDDIHVVEVKMHGGEREREEERERGGMRKREEEKEREEERERGEESVTTAAESESAAVKQGTGPELETVQQELERVKKLLEARETKMLETSREMIQLTESNQDLQSRLAAAEEDLHTSQGGVDQLRSEFTKRISTTEKKLQIVIKERDSLKKQLQVLTAEHSHQKKSASEEMSTLLKEREEQIAGLMEEGEKLSKKELQNSNVIKRLKEKNKQNDQLLTAQRQQIEDCEREIGRLKELVKKKEDNERKYQESLAQLNSIAEQQEKELTTLKAERDDLVDKARSLQTNLDNAYRELSELHKATAVNKSVAHEALLSAEQTARQELTEALEKNRVESAREKEKLLLEISELRASVSRCEQQAAWREERMKQEVSDLQQRLQEAEMRNQELSTTISQTTKPFLRQIETLHSAHSTQTANWEKMEASLTQRLVEAQSQLSLAVEKERSATEKSMTLQSRVTQLERQAATLRQEKSRLTASLELERAKAETLEESQQRDSAKTEAVRTSLQQSLEELRKEKEMLERQLEYERVRLEAESRKACLESQEKERLRSQLASSLSRGLSRQSSSASTSHTQSEISEKSLVRELSGGGGGGGNMDTSHYHSRTSASAMEQLQSLLKQKEGELANAQSLVSSLERSRAAMANDLAAVSGQNSELTEKVETIPQLTTKLQELQHSNEALLQMYGEKAELAEELKLDIQDLKDMYRQQIDALTKR